VIARETFGFNGFAGIFDDTSRRYSHQAALPQGKISPPEGKLDFRDKVLNHTQIPEPEFLKFFKNPYIEVARSAAI
jgi:hypothetical protein